MFTTAEPGKIMARWIALLRGINVGGRHRLNMKDVVAVFEAAGCTGVRTFIQSGNVVFDIDGPCDGSFAASIDRKSTL